MVIITDYSSYDATTAPLTRRRFLFAGFSLPAKLTTSVVRAPGSP